MIDKNRDARDAAALKAADEARAKTPADTSAVKSADAAVEKAKADVRDEADKPVVTKTTVTKEAAANVPHTSGYSAGNPYAVENPGKLSSTGISRVSKVEAAKVVAPEMIADRVAEKVANDLAFDEKATALDLARRALDGTGDGTVLGRDSRPAFVDHSRTAVETLTEIDRQSAILNKARQDSKGQQEVADRRDDARVVDTRDANNTRLDTVRDENARRDNKL